MRQELGGMQEATDRVLLELPALAPQPLQGGVMGENEPGYLRRLGQQITSEQYADAEPPLEVRVHNARLRDRGGWTDFDSLAKARSVKRRTTPKEGR
jgi:hypothetical protein